MRISFDLDEVLFVNLATYKIEEPPHGIAGWFLIESVRTGRVRQRQGRKGGDTMGYADKLTRRIMEEVGKYNNRREVVRAGFLEILTVKFLSPDEMHPNPEDHCRDAGERCYTYCTCLQKVPEKDAEESDRAASEEPPPG